MRECGGRRGVQGQARQRGGCVFSPASLAPTQRWSLHGFDSPGCLGKCALSIAPPPNPLQVPALLAAAALPRVHGDAAAGPRPARCGRALAQVRCRPTAAWNCALHRGCEGAFYAAHSLHVTASFSAVATCCTTNPRPLPCPAPAPQGDAVHAARRGSRGCGAV